MALTRRGFLAAAAAPMLRAAEPIIDIHQHTNYLKRSDEELVAHQRKMGVTKTVLLPAGSRYGLAAEAYGNDSVVALTKKYPEEFVYFANEVSDLPEAVAVIRKYVEGGAIGIGEQKFKVESDSVHIEKIAELATEFSVPVLMHFEHGNYNLEFQRFHRMLDKYPKVNFIGHAQTWWANIDAKADQTVMYPKTPVTPGGLTDRYLSEYPNMYADLSANSGLNSMLRDEDHARQFLSRHRAKILFGSDCPDRDGEGAKCTGSQCIATVRRLAPDAAVARMILHDNAARLLHL